MVRHKGTLESAEEVDKVLKRMRSLDDLCDFADACSESNYGELDRCTTDYQNCQLYSKLIKERNNWQDKYYNGR